MSSPRTYLAIDLKSFYASVECVARGLDPMDANLVVADKSRTEKTICLAVSPALKAYGISGRARLFEVVQRVKEINNQRTRFAPGHQLVGSSTSAKELAEHPALALDYIAAPPQMAHYAPGICPNHDSGCAVLHRHHRHSRHRHQSVSCENCHGHWRKAHCPGRIWRPNCPAG